MVVKWEIFRVSPCNKILIGLVGIGVVCMCVDCKLEVRYYGWNKFSN